MKATAPKDKPARLPRHYKPTYLGRPLQYREDRAGNCWLCDKGASPWSDHPDKACWRCEYMAFPLGGR